MSARSRTKHWTSDKSYEVDLKPLPRWKQKRAALVARWRRGRNQRQNARRMLASAGRQALTLAISVLGAMLISYGVYTIHPSAGYIVGGLLCWVLLWSHEKDKERR